jgi:hypothetical protein
MQVRLPPDSELPPDLKSQGEQIGLGATEPVVLDRLGRFVLAAVQSAVAFIVEYIIKIASRVAIYFAGAVMRAEDRNAAEFRALTNAALQDLTGVDRGAGNKAIGKTLLESLSGGAGAAPGGTLGPSTAGAEAYMEIVMQLALEGYVEGGITSALSLGYLDKFTELDDILAQVLGLGRMSRRVMQPLMGAKVITPMQWHVNKLYRPELLSPADAVRQYLRHNWTWEQTTEELARQGWSAERIDALVEAQRKFFSPSDIRQFVTREHWNADQGTQHLLDQGYTEEEARDALRLEGLKRFEQLEAAEGGAIVTAYANHEIDDGEFDDLMAKQVKNTTERNLLTELGLLRRRLNVRYLTPAEERRLAIAGIRNVIDYRRALERAGYQPDAVAALDLELRAELANRRADEALRAQQQAEREAEERQAAEARAARLAAIAAEKALPSVADVRRAYVHGHLSVDRYRAAVEASHPGIDGADLAALVAEAEADRGAYLATLERRRLAELEEADAAIPLGALQAAVKRGVITLEDYARDLRDRQYDEAEINLLAGILRGELEDAAAAAAKRAEAEQRAAAGGVSLNAWERAVRLGLRTIEQYGAYLASIDTPELARALIVDVLRAQVAIDAEARAKRQAAEAEAAPRGISLERRRRAVILGLRDLDYYRRALVEARLPPEDQQIEIELVQVELAEAAAARARRDEIAAELEARQAREAEEAAAREAAGEAPAPPTELTLAQVERAVKLGLLAPADLERFALAKGYAPDDAALLVELATFQVPDLREGARRRETIREELAAKRVSLEDLERAVLRGIRTLADFETELTGRGYGEDDTALLAQLLAERVAVDMAGLRKKIGAALDKTDGARPLEAIQGEAIDGILAPAAAIAELEAAGVVRDTALVYVRLLLTHGAEG